MVAETGALVGVALERLNRQSVLGLLQQVVHEIDEHCRRFPELTSGAISTLRLELESKIQSLQLTIADAASEREKLGSSVAELKAQFGDWLANLEVSVNGLVGDSLTLRLPDIIEQIRNTINVTIQEQAGASVTEAELTALTLKLNELNDKLELLRQATAALEGGDLKQIEALIQKALLNIELSPVLINMPVEINGSKISLHELLVVLAGGDRVAQTHFTYDSDDITGARFVLVDNTIVNFTCERHDSPSDEITLVFKTDDWKGVPAAFSIRFAKQTTELSMCGRTIALDSYDVLYQTNVVFDLLGAVVTVDPLVCVAPPEAPETPEAPNTPGESGESGESGKPEDPEAPAKPIEPKIINGSFEVCSARQTLKAGDGRLRGWNVGGAGIDWIDRKRWQAGDKLRKSIDLNATGPGGVSQPLKTVPGARYRITFALAGNPGGTQGLKTLRVSAGKSAWKAFTFDTRGKSAKRMGWVQRNYEFTAKTKTTMLRFQSKTAGNSGPALDNVRIRRLS